MGINQEAQKIAADNSFEIEKPIKIISETLIIFLGKYNGRSAILKVANSSKGKNFSRELEIDEILDIVLGDKQKSFDYPRVLSSGDGEYNWVIRDYILGRQLSAGPGESERYFFGYDRLNAEIINEIPIIAQRIIIFLEFIKKLRYSNTVIKIKNYHCLKNRYLFDLEGYPLEKISQKIKVDINNQISFYNKVAKNYRDESQLTLTHGDFNPGNIIIGENKNLIITDFEWLCFDNYTFDLAFIWLFLWNYPDFQWRLIQSLLTTDADKNFFRASIIRQIIGYYSVPIIMLQGQKLDNYLSFQRKNWLRYLAAAGESFEALMEVSKK